MHPSRGWRRAKGTSAGTTRFFLKRTPIEQTPASIPGEIRKSANAAVLTTIHRATTKIVAGDNALLTNKIQRKSIDAHVNP